MDEARIGKVQYLARCTFRPGSYEKRFVRDMASRPDDELTIRQAHYIDLLYWMYRQQIAAMDGDDKPEVYRPGELMVELAVEPKPAKKMSQQEKRMVAALEKLAEWNARSYRYLNEVDPKRPYYGWPGPVERMKAEFEWKLDEVNDGRN